MCYNDFKLIESGVPVENTVEEYQQLLEEKIKNRTALPVMKIF